VQIVLPRPVGVRLHGRLSSNVRRRTPTLQPSVFDHRIELATLNNVFWYQAMFLAHGIGHASDDLTWWTTAAPPPFHSNLVVLSPRAADEHIRQQLRSIERALSPGGLSMKDSFAKLDLSASGYEILFEASWIWREPGVPRHPGTTDTSAAWSVVTSPAELQAWEDTWWGDERNKLAAPASCQFPASLLASPNHRFLIKMKGRRIVAGAIASRSPGAVGLSNTFCLGSAMFNDWDGLIQCASEHFPGVPLVGYERGAALECALSAGFAATGPLRVWNRAPR
jgi:hypothetical protein